MDTQGEAGIVTQAGAELPHLDRREQREAALRRPIGPLVIHEIVREQGEAELQRSFSGLAWSGLAAGLSIGFSMVTQAYLEAGLGQAPWSNLVASFGYSLGFLIVILGRQQLFTETTLTAVIPALTRRTPDAVLGAMRVWVVVLGANLIGTVLFAILAAQPGMFAPDAVERMGVMAHRMVSGPFWQTTMRAAAAGWLIGLMVWLLPAAGSSRPFIIILLTYVIAMCHFPHGVAGSVEAAFGVASGRADVGDYLGGFLAPTLLGNAVGGTVLAALLNHAPVSGELEAARRG